MIAQFLLVILVAYILGSIPFGVLVSRRHSNIDIMQYGSGKIGATNVLRTAGKKAAALVLVLDLVKGVLAVILAKVIFGDSYIVVGSIGLGNLVVQVVAALAAVVGHNWSVFLNFRGGRGVSTFFGGMMALCPPAALFGGEVLFLSAGLTKYMSIGSIAGTVAAYAILIPLTMMHGFPIEYLIYALIGGVMIIIMHRDNIYRLVSGKERKLGEKAESINTTGSTGT
jgi:acyl phosphate:glycerol-3-phosphate acyltransferase